MNTVLHWTLPALWIAWLAYWAIAARSTKETRRQESRSSRFSHYAPLIAGAVILGWPDILGAQLEQRFPGPLAVWLSLGVALVALGLAFSAAARAKLGGNWSATITLKKDHELIRGGPYALVRHPIYTGMLLAFFGSALAIGRWRALVGLVLLAAGLLRKMAIEERLMTEQFGEAYARYRAEVPALIPFLI